MASRNYSQLTIKKLYSYGLNKCYNPNCKIQIIFDEDDDNLSEIAHICAKNKGGLRYNENMADKERDLYDNLILLCPICHIKVDNNESKYTVGLLKEWKELRKKEAVSSSTSLLHFAVNAIAEIEDFDKYAEVDNINPFRPEEKMDFNSLKKNRMEIEDFKMYQGKIDAIYKELENIAPFKKQKLLNVIKCVYNKKRSKILGNNINSGKSNIEIIRENSDLLYDEVKETIENELLNSCSNENIIIALPIIMVDAFIRCKILEEPKNDSK